VTIATADATLPSRGEAAELVPPEDGVTRRIAGDARLFAGSGYALLLQVTHPTVGAGVSQHSNFKRDPWGRLLRTLDYTTALTYGGPDLASEVGRRVREMHGRIAGVRPDGARYHALDPEPYAWVHATLAESIVRAHRLFCSPRLGPSELEDFWREWRRMGRLVGVRYEDLPESWPELLAYFDEMVQTKLEDTEAAQDVLAALRDPAPPVPWLRGPVWRVVRWPPATVAELATIGLLPPPLRERLELRWSPRREIRFRALARVSRAYPRQLMLPPARRFGPSYLRWRGSAIAR
jgi:uncharacterized protein (DUF2236 family)